MHFNLNVSIVSSYINMVSIANSSFLLSYIKLDHNFDNIYTVFGDF
jgi:hypothetical protein